MAAMLRNVVVVVHSRVEPFELAVLCEVFGTDRSDDGLPVYDFAVVTAEPGPVTTNIGFTIDLPYDLARLEEADLIAVAPPGSPDAESPPELLAALRRAVDRGARVLSVCTGAFVLGAAGLLDDRPCTTHWRHADALQRRYPRARVDPDVLYVDDGAVLTSAGSAAAIDLGLYIIRQADGVAVANAIARRMVVPPQREGGQRQYVETPVPSSQADTLEPLLSWMLANLGEEMSVEDLAARVHLSPRTFARRFRAETGATPHHWLTGQRILLAQRLLEESEHGIDSVADLAGFGSAAVLRHHFVRRVGTTPQAYRRTFRRRPA
jgi:transcriptional regulator GlxA family with amidase domain